MGSPVLYSGLKIQVNNNAKGLVAISIPYCDLEDFVKENPSYNINDLSILSREPKLYKVDVKEHENNLARLDRIRSEWDLNHFDYKFYTEEEVEELLIEQGLVIAVEGVGEVESVRDLADAHGTYNPTNIARENFYKKFKTF
ncbi:hypothetical protein [Halalkalibacter sp. APA_J-10(15)]|uniref:hypothetical protein n=1 Tax=Halalkalibacter sp. APA_J-10(15) TaxID=2933805 RepID=UPI001FF3ACFF|nr:hypothetical protein [Halalkalibacter sp. APA_J-10(15)]MCK0470864.1 hypothetical protein [Halalkalibacter sp. APA_J-10(15)]